MQWNHYDDLFISFEYHATIIVVKLIIGIFRKSYLEQSVTGSLCVCLHLAVSFRNTALVEGHNI